MKSVLATLTLALATPAHGAKDWPSRAKAVKGALKDAFRAYEKHASGFDDLAPVSRRGVNWLHARATLVDALDSLYVVGLREDYERAVNEVLRPTLVGEPPFWQSVSVFEYHIRVVGGLLGAFEVSGDRRLLHAASHAADRVLSVLPRKLGDAYTRTRQRLADPYGRPILWLVARIIDEVQACVESTTLSPRHRSDAVMGSSSRRWRGTSTLSSRRSYGDNIASMAWVA